MSESLFRREALEAKRGSWLGSISLAQPLPLWAMTAFAAGAALAIGLFLTLGSYTRRSTVVGQLVPTRGLATVLAPATGVVTELDSAEGRRVRAGQSLAVVSLPRATVNEGDTAAAMAQRLARRQQGLQDAHRAQSQLLNAQAGGLLAQLDAARRELAQLEQEIATRQGQVWIADETLQRLRQLQADKYVSALQVKQQEAAWLQAVSDVQAMQRQAITARRSLAQLQQARQELPGQRLASNADFQRDLAALEQEQVETEARGALAVSAPVTGVIATQLVKPGQAVQAGQPLLSLLPGNGMLEAELLVPSRAIGFIEPGDKVLLRYQAYPYQKFGHQQGTVTRISRSALSSGELGTLIGNAQQGEPFYRITVALARQTVTAYGKAELLKPGMLLEADVLGDKRRLIEWVFEPLYSLQGKVGNN
ncbi:HlyD family efflux transporter periplasmic adaptor subunit [Thermomonas brevis]|uniref:HlyD family efflux transporter periplasmic adaptor subunit n=1 Tax=Thermomonas brevis TaxID=215691 RepID=A0A7G9QPT0_9GAMM|nr:HlyD family efflux transporter periplasmic adaptor subunit [Thermomonas brevis]QNN45355.1 HlyD family efflux transporter periplasmic adaptor subunit [Thermomonas brevis]